jgi:hypothetical protein
MLKLFNSALEKQKTTLSVVLFLSFFIINVCGEGIGNTDVPSYAFISAFKLLQRVKSFYSFEST